MTIVAGPLCPDDTIEQLRAAAAAETGVRIVGTVPDLVEEMLGASISVSQCGYNTALDILQAGLPALVVPFADNGDSEQSDRARRLERMNAVRVLPPSELQPHTLAAAMRATMKFVPDPVAFDLDGGTRSARLIAEFCRAAVA
jgi:predicted glycosyltransferase